MYSYHNGCCDKGLLIVIECIVYILLKPAVQKENVFFTDGTRKSTVIGTSVYIVNLLA